jgi:hypothetical protein
MPRNAMSQPVMVNHNCPQHGQQLQAPVSYAAVCRCGRRCEIDVAAWMAEASAHYPNESLEQLSAEAGIGWAQVEQAIQNQTEE